MKITVDYDVCESNGFCEDVAPNIFHLDDNEDLHVLAEPTEETVDDVRRAVAACPRAAIALRTD